MKFNEEAFWENIQSGKYLPAYLVKGSEWYQKKKYTDILRDRVVPDGLKTFNEHRFDGSAGMEEIIMAAEQLPVMCDKTCVIVHDYDFSSISDGDSKQLIEYLENPSDMSVLIFWQDSNPFSSKGKKQKDILKAFEEAGAVADLNGRSENDLIRFIEKGCKRRGRKIDRKVAGYLLSSTNRDMMNLENEMDKVCSFSDGNITEEDIDAVVIKTLEATSFQMVNALLSGRPERCLTDLSVLFEQRTEPSMILGALISNYSDMYRVKVAKECRVRPAELKKLFPNTYKKDFRITKAEQNSRRFTKASLRESLELLSEADRALKRSTEDPSVVMEKLMVELYRIKEKQC